MAFCMKAAGRFWQSLQVAMQVMPVCNPPNELLCMFCMQVTEQPGAPGELPFYLYSFDEQQNMQPFVETESEDEMDTSAALKTGASHDRRPSVKLYCSHTIVSSLVNVLSSDCQTAQTQNAVKSLTWRMSS